MRDSAQVQTCSPLSEMLWHKPLVSGTDNVGERRGNFCLKLWDRRHELLCLVLQKSQPSPHGHADPPWVLCRSDLCRGYHVLLELWWSFGVLQGAVQLCWRKGLDNWCAKLLVACSRKGRVSGGTQLGCRIYPGFMATLIYTQLLWFRLGSCSHFTVTSAAENSCWVHRSAAPGAGGNRASFSPGCRPAAFTGPAHWAGMRGCRCVHQRARRMQVWWCCHMSWYNSVHIYVPSSCCSERGRSQLRGLCNPC